MSPCTENSAHCEEAVQDPALVALTPEQRDGLRFVGGVCHEANRQYCLALGDTSQPSWADAQPWQRESAMLGVLSIVTDPLHGPEQSHEQWQAKKEADGWVYGPIKDPEKKQHPCMVPYWRLPVEQRRKDRLFLAISLALRPMLAPLFPDIHPGIRPEHIAKLIGQCEWDYADMGNKTYTLLAELPCGFELTASSACIDPANYDPKMGNTVAKGKIEDKLWELEGYRLQNILAE